MAKLEAVPLEEWKHHDHKFTTTLVTGEKVVVHFECGVWEGSCFKSVCLDINDQEIVFRSFLDTTLLELEIQQFYEELYDHLVRPSFLTGEQRVKRFLQSQA